jgi:capsular polysaccharide biosynthesis protein/Mrp family chromosome partitioning ATPase
LSAEIDGPGFKLYRFERRDTDSIARVSLSGRFVGGGNRLSDMPVLAVLRRGEVVLGVARWTGAGGATATHDPRDWSVTFAVRRDVLDDGRDTAFQILRTGYAPLRLPAPHPVERAEAATLRPAVGDDPPEGAPPPSRHQGRSERLRYRGRAHVARAPTQRLRMAIACAVAAGLAAAASLVLAPRPYHATAMLVVAPIQSRDANFAGLPLLRGDSSSALKTAVAILKQPQTAALTANRLGGNWSEPQVASHVRIAIDSNTSLIDITGSAGSEVAAMELANVYADTALTLRERAIQPAVAAALQDARAGLRPNRAERNAASIAAANRLLALEALQDGGDPTIQLARPALTASRPSSLQDLALVLLAVACGGFLGLSWGWLAGRRGARAIQSERQIAELTGLPVLARLPQNDGLSADRERGIAHEWQNLLAWIDRGGPGSETIAITAAWPGDGTGEVATGLGSFLAAGGESVALLDLDRGTLDAHRRLGLPIPSPRSGGRDRESSRGRTMVTAPHSPGLLVGMPEAGEPPVDRIVWAHSIVRRLIVNAPSTGSLGERAGAAEMAVMIVVTLDRTPEHALVEAQNALARTGVRTLGVVLLVGGRRLRVPLSRDPASVRLGRYVKSRSLAAAERA